MRRVKISVFNNDYFIKTDAEDEYIQQIVTYLEEKIKETSPQIGAISVPRPFLLATIKIADDYLRLKREFEEFKNRAEERTRRLVEILDSAKRIETFSPQSEEQRRESQKDQQEDSFKER